MKTFVIALVVIALIILGTTLCQAKELGEAGLEITGGALVGVQEYTGASTSNSDTVTTLTKSNSVSNLELKGASVMSSSNGTICVTSTLGNSIVSGNGTFKSGMSSGSIMLEGYGDVDFYTNSTITITGGNSNTSN